MDRGAGSIVVPPAPIPLLEYGETHGKIQSQLNCRWFAHTQVHMGLGLASDDRSGSTIALRYSIELV